MIWFNIRDNELSSSGLPNTRVPSIIKFLSQVGSSFFLNIYNKILVTYETACHMFINTWAATSEEWLMYKINHFGRWYRVSKIICTGLYWLFCCHYSKFIRNQFLPHLIQLNQWFLLHEIKYVQQKNTKFTVDGLTNFIHNLTFLRPDVFSTRYWIILL